MTTQSLNNLKFKIDCLSDEIMDRFEVMEHILAAAEHRDTVTIDGEIYVRATQVPQDEPSPLEGIVRTMDIYRGEYGLSDGDIAKLTNTSVEQVKQMLGKPLSAYLANMAVTTVEEFEDDPL